ncbi:uncharacterized protein CANTADRAFT_295068 [Suhomyces tanzawaensis NRRL Y-17324]|uniref:Uncharacterized protein n=1 Tax=Suhomyces tanzawaensis NRRL Y-17324 TaxID=984487 RepID=A0A1E4SF00_9ASCO|nr:uncharacterized protein CANTADRAFT_295068 [Suhomyces tanzawaensis NRRL Y-17324]ODV78063.1 hypothetical protein CANTADRAFT_295068 [Suhomyces tanzawaensis NRRL Y-17324]
MDTTTSTRGGPCSSSNHQPIVFPLVQPKFLMKILSNMSCFYEVPSLAHQVAKNHEKTKLNSKIN